MLFVAKWFPPDQCGSRCSFLVQPKDDTYRYECNQQMFARRIFYSTLGTGSPVPVRTYPLLLRLKRIRVRNSILQRLGKQIEDHRLKTITSEQDWNVGREVIFIRRTESRAYSECENGERRVSSTFADPGAS